MRGSNISFPYIISLISFPLMAMGMLVYPEQTVNASLTAIAIWWDILFPALFPFFVITELMLGLGIVHCLATLLDPLMKPLFRVSGSGGFVMAMGFASGYPVGAKLSSELWHAGLLGKKECQRLIAFTTTADPIFLIGAVSIGFFRDISLAPLIAVAHYGGALVLGILMRWTDSEEHLIAANNTPMRQPRRQPILQRAFIAMHTARITDGRSVGTLLFDGIRNGLKLIIVIGGLVIFFSVMIQLLMQWHVLSGLQFIAGAMFALLQIPSAIATPLVNGIFEVTLGARMAGSLDQSIPLQYKVAIASFVLAWAGLSVHAQIMSLVAPIQLKYLPFAVAKLAHGLISALISYFLWDIFKV
jgi:sporulation integral membrane protein YlbJ